MTETQIDPKDAAILFSELLRKELGEEKIQEVVKRNKAYCVQYGDKTCASHDFCDANMIMNEALMSLGLKRLGPDLSKTERNLWNGAWSLAKKHEFDAEKIQVVKMLELVKPDCDASELACRITSAILSTQGMKEVVKDETNRHTGYFGHLARLVDQQLNDKN